MQLLDRYLHAVSNHLPAKQRDDILLELRENILDSAEARQAELGRPLTLEEEETLLEELGHPALVAVRYRPKQFPIGPSTFPYYLLALKTVLLLALLVYAVVNAVALAALPFTWRRVVEALFGVQSLLFTTAAWVTLAFVVLEYGQSHWLRKFDVFANWSARNLPEVPAKPPYSPWRAACEWIASGVALAWVLLVPHFPSLVLGPAAQHLHQVTLAPQWTLFYWAFVAFMFLQWLVGLAALANARLRVLRPALGSAARVIVAVLFALLLRVPAFLWLNEAGRAAGRSQSLVDAIDGGIRISLKALIAILVLQVLWQLARLTHLAPARAVSKM